MCFCDPLGDGETKAAAGGVFNVSGASLYAIKSLKYFALILSWNADTVILYDQGYVRPLCRWKLFYPARRRI